MNKKVLMLAPFMGLILTSCNKWAVVKKEKAYEIRDNIHYFLVPPKTWHAAYDGGKGVIAGQEINMEGDMFAYDYNRCYAAMHSINFAGYLEANYYVVIDNVYYNLVDNGQQKYRTVISDTPEDFRSIFEANFYDQAKSLLMNIFITGTLEGEVEQVEYAQELAKEDPEHVKASYEFTSSNSTSLRFTYSTYMEGEQQGVTMSSDSTCDAKIENGLLRYAKMNMKMSAGKETTTLIDGTVRYKYNKPTIPTFNLEDWPEQE